MLRHLSALNSLFINSLIVKCKVWLNVTFWKRPKQNNFPFSTTWKPKHELSARLYSEQTFSCEWWSRSFLESYSDKYHHRCSFPISLSVTAQGKYNHMRPMLVKRYHKPPRSSWREDCKYQKHEKALCSASCELSAWQSVCKREGGKKGANLHTWKTSTHALMIHFITSYILWGRQGWTSPPRLSGCQAHSS